MFHSDGDHVIRSCVSVELGATVASRRRQFRAASLDISLQDQRTWKQKFGSEVF